jgi:predicted nucleic acid-binding protein
MKNLFLDTNVVIDLLEKREPYWYDAALLFTMAYNKQARLFISPMTYATASFLLHKHGAENVRHLLFNLRQLAHVSSANEHTVDSALSSQFKDFEDALQYYSAQQAKVDIIITRNGKDFLSSTLPVMTPREFLDLNDITTLPTNS